jgi:hypothetical protein
MPLPVLAVYLLAMGQEERMPPALFGFRDGVAWVADDVFVTRYAGGNLLVERWAGLGVRSAMVRAESQGFMRAMWLKLNALAVDGTPPLQV